MKRIDHFSMRELPALYTFHFIHILCTFNFLLFCKYTLHNCEILHLLFYKSTKMRTTEIMRHYVLAQWQNVVHVVVLYNMRNAGRRKGKNSIFQILFTKKNWYEDMCMYSRVINLCSRWNVTSCCMEHVLWRCFQSYMDVLTYVRDMGTPLIWCKFMIWHPDWLM